jgi:hypothetical protein
VVTASGTHWGKYLREGSENGGKVELRGSLARHRFLI